MTCPALRSLANIVSTAPCSIPAIASLATAVLRPKDSAQASQALETAELILQRRQPLPMPP